MADNRISAITSEIEELKGVILKAVDAGEDLGDVLDDALEGVKQGVRDVAQEVSKADNKTSQFAVDWGKVGSTANASLGILTAALSKTNPMLSSALTLVQRMMPNMVDLANGFKAYGAAAKAAGVASNAAFPWMAIINFAIVAVTGLVTEFDKLNQATREASAQGLSDLESKLKSVKNEAEAAAQGINKGTIASLQYQLVKAQQELDRLVRVGTEGPKNIKEAWEAGITGSRLSKDITEQKEEINRLNGLITQTQKILDVPAPEVVKTATKDVKKLTASVDEFSQEMQQFPEYTSKVVDFNKAVKDTWDSFTKFQESSISGLGNVDVSSLDASRQVMAEFWESTNPEKYFQAQLLSYKDYLTNIGIETDVINALMAKKQKEHNEEIALSYASSYGSMVDSIASVGDSLVQMGTISEEQNNKIKAVTKAAAVGEIVANTAVGVSKALATKGWVGIAEASAIIASGVAGVAATMAESINALKGGVGSTSASTQSASVVYNYNSGAASDMSGVINAINDKDNTPVLVVEDVTAAQKSRNRVKVSASF